MKTSAQADYYLHSRPEMLPFLPEKPGKVLDIGCGTGQFGRMLKAERQAQVWGLEPVPAVSQQAAEYLDGVQCGTAEEAAQLFAGQTFDWISFNDVLEHILDPESVLMSIKPLFSENGRLLASIPNFLQIYNLEEVVLRREWEYKEAGILDKTHVRFFTRKSIIAMMDRCGYTIERMEGINLMANRKWRILNRLTFGYFTETFPLQYAVVARPKR